MKKAMHLSKWKNGKEHKASANGDLIVTKEDGVTMGEPRVFWWTCDQMYDTPILYVADREFKKWWPRKNVIWWKYADIDKRLMELEEFVNDLATIKNYEGWQGKYFQKAREISKKGFLMKLKGEDDERQ